MWLYEFLIGYVVGTTSRKIPAWTLTAGILSLTAVVIFLHWLAVI